MIGLGAELRKIGFGLEMVAFIFNLRSWTAWLETGSYFQKQSNGPAVLDTELDYEHTTT